MNESLYIGDEILKRLGGKPEHFECVKVHKITGLNHYRVNVWINHPELGHNISDSFWLTVEDGVILDSNPEIKVKYETSKNKKKGT